LEAPGRVGSVLHAGEDFVVLIRAVLPEPAPDGAHQSTEDGPPLVGGFVPVLVDNPGDPARR